MVLSHVAVLYIPCQEGNMFRDKMRLLSDSFGISGQNELAITAASADDILEFSKIAIGFATEYRVDRNRALSFGLVTEELSGLFAGHSFADGEPHNINVRLVAKENDLIIRIRDDCRPFNMTEYYQMIKGIRNREEEIGLKIIMYKAKEDTCNAAFGADNLIGRM